MKEERYHIALDDYEHGVVIRAWNDTKTELMSECKSCLLYTALSLFPARDPPQQNQRKDEWTMTEFSIYQINVDLSLIHI